MLEIAIKNSYILYKKVVFMNIRKFEISNHYSRKKTFKNSNLDIWSLKKWFRLAN